MSSAEARGEGRKRRKRLRRDCDADLDLLSNTKRVISELMIKIKEEAEKDWQKMRDETMKRAFINSVASEVGFTLDNAESKLKEERQKFVEALAALLKHSNLTALGKSLEEMPLDGISTSTLIEYLHSLDNASEDHVSPDD